MVNKSFYFAKKQTCNGFITYKNFGPILDSTKIELTSLVVLNGHQSSGKSTFMKVLCFCSWVEKRIMVSTDDIVSQYTHYNRFIKDLKLFYRLNDEYFKVNTELRMMEMPLVLNIR